MIRLLALMRRRRPEPTTKPIDSEQLLRIYRETHRRVEELRRAA
ncbi:MAG: hypothetical protein WAL31_14380 [Gaiellaceae bacterium]